MKKPQKEADKPLYVFREEGELIIPHRIVTGTALPELRPAMYELVQISEAGDLGMRPVKAVAPPKKIYGTCHEDSTRWIRTYLRSTDNVGVLCIGQKGSGKTTTARVMVKTVIEMGMPVIVIDHMLPPQGVRNVLASIEQDCMVLLDEFDKTYARVVMKDDDEDRFDSKDQNSLLTILDGSIGGGKKLFVLIANDEKAISEYLVNRPGRIRYRKEFEVLPDTVLIQYLKDNLKNLKDIDVYHFLKMKLYTHGELNFDMMTAIVDEMNHYGGTVLQNAVLLFGRSLFANGSSGYCMLDIILPTGESIKINGMDTYDANNNIAGINSRFALVQETPEHVVQEGQVHVNEMHFVGQENDYQVLVYQNEGLTIKARRNAATEDYEVISGFTGTKLKENVQAEPSHLITKNSLEAATAFSVAWRKHFNYPEQRIMTDDEKKPSAFAPPQYQPLHGERNPQREHQRQVLDVVKNVVNSEWSAGPGSMRLLIQGNRSRPNTNDSDGAGCVG